MRARSTPSASSAASSAASTAASSVGLPRLLVIMGSGETAPTMKGPHRQVFEQLAASTGGSVDAVLLDTPFGFQENVEILAAKTAEYFTDAVSRHVAIAGLARTDHGDVVGIETAIAKIRAADWVFAGPGSPTFALRQWTGTPIPEAIGAKLPIAAFIILLLLVAQFNSLRKSAIVLATIPLGLIGVVASLLLGQSFFGFMTLLGVVSLAGIVINNAIVLLERIGLELAAGASHLDAILNAAVQRARPIMLTTATTVLGLLPLYLGGGEMWEPMALAIMGGLVVSTVFTLGVIPVLYATLYGVRGRAA